MSVWLITKYGWHYPYLSDSCHKDACNIQLYYLKCVNEKMSISSDIRYPIHATKGNVYIYGIPMHALLPTWDGTERF